MNEWKIISQDSDNEVTKSLKVAGGTLYCHMYFWRNNEGKCTQSCLTFVADEKPKDNKDY